MVQPSFIQCSDLCSSIIKLGRARIFV